MKKLHRKAWESRTRWLFLVLLWSASCAVTAAQQSVPAPSISSRANVDEPSRPNRVASIKKKAPDPFIPPLEDLACETDADCGIVGDSSVNTCRQDPEVEPYAISHAAAARHRASLVCDGKETLEQYIAGCHTNPDDWIAVCSEHRCKRHRVHASPLVRCKP